MQVDINAYDSIVVDVAFLREEYILDIELPKCSAKKVAQIIQIWIYR
jgi:hypothetical protein